MFIPRSPIRHEFGSPAFAIGERRMVFGFKESLTSAGSSIASGFGKVKTGVKWATLPTRMVMWPVTKPLSLAYKSLVGLKRIAKTPYYTGKHLVKGTVWETAAKSSWELIKAPLRNLKINYVDNFRETIRAALALPLDALSLPKNIVLSPFRFAKEMWNRVKKTRTSISGVFGKGFKLEGRGMLGNLKDAVLTPLTAPAAAAMMALMPATYQHVSKIGENMLESQIQYLTSLDSFQKQVREGVSHVINAHDYAEAEMDHNEMEEAKALATKTNPKEPGKTVGKPAPTEEEHPGKGKGKPEKEKGGHGDHGKEKHGH